MTQTAADVPNVVRTDPPPAPLAPLAPASPLPAPGAPAAVAPVVTAAVAPTPPAAPTPAQPVPSPVAPAPAPSNLDLPVVKPDGTTVLMRDLLGAHSTVQEMRLDDPDTAAFMTTISRASRGDQAAMQALTALGEQVQPAAPVAPANLPAAFAPASPGVPGVPVVPVAPAPASTAVPSAGSAEAIAAVIRQAIEPIVQQQTRIGSFMDGIQRQEDVGKLTAHLATQKEAYPRLAGNDLATRRVYSEWESMRSAAKSRGGAQPDFRDLQRLMQSEESYLASAAPPAAAPVAGTQVVRHDMMDGRVPGRPLPGSVPAPVAPGAVPGAVVPAAVSTTMPVAGAPGPAVAAPANPNQPMTRASLLAKCEADARTMIAANP